MGRDARDRCEVVRIRHIQGHAGRSLPLCISRAHGRYIPDVDKFPALVAELHRRGVAPNGKFGFPYVAYGGRAPTFFPVSDSWEETFVGAMQHSFELEKATHGYDEDMEYLRKNIIKKVIPRLIRPLRIIARLVHGDMWDGNCSVDMATNKPVVFDANTV